MKIIISCCIALSLFCSCSSFGKIGTAKKHQQYKCKYEQKVEYLECVKFRVEYSIRYTATPTDREYNFILFDCCRQVDGLYE